MFWKDGSGAPTKEALLIDPVLEQVDRDLAEAARLGGASSTS